MEALADDALLSSIPIHVYVADVAAVPRKPVESSTDFKLRRSVQTRRSSRLSIPCLDSQNAIRWEKIFMMDDSSCRRRGHGVERVEHTSSESSF